MPTSKFIDSLTAFEDALIQRDAAQKELDNLTGKKPAIPERDIRIGAVEASIAFNASLEDAKAKAHDADHALQSAIDEVESHLSEEVIQRLKTEPAHVSEETDSQVIGLYWLKGMYAVARAKDRAYLQSAIDAIRRQQQPKKK